MASISVMDMPLAYIEPTSAPELVPTTMSGTMPLASSALITPNCAKPRGPPLPKASAITGRPKALRCGCSKLAPRSPR